ncbi:hypothetical protein B4144_3076 [Bacillus atrophaeus]|nr:hypothetical protein B4144_3076 [Bacillus atrophaeus]
MPDSIEMADDGQPLETIPSPFMFGVKHLPVRFNSNKKARQ